MKKILLTGFQPFGGEPINPAGEIVKRLQQPENTQIIRMILPVEYESALPALREAIAEYQPDIVLSFGQAGICPDLTPEKVAINFATTRSGDGRTLITDEAGVAMDDVPLTEEGPAAYFTTLPIRGMCAASQAVGVNARVSYSAGTYLCNATMYTALHEAAKHYPEMKCDFIHVPFLPQQLQGKDNTRYPTRYAMELEEMLRGTQAMLNYLAE